MPESVCQVVGAGKDFLLRAVRGVAEKTLQFPSAADTRYAFVTVKTRPN
jgi:hypothetical protein